jgi:hypothetical protein
MRISISGTQLDLQTKRAYHRMGKSTNIWAKIELQMSGLLYKHKLGLLHAQHKEMLKKLNKACNDLVCDHWLSLHEAITYVNSDLVSI